MDDVILKVVARLTNIHDKLGEAAYREAGRGALLAIAKASLSIAERRAHLGKGMGDSLLRFPMPRRKDNKDEEGDG